MADILVGILLGVIGLLVCVAGLRVFFVALPLVGFVSGFFIGAAGIRSFLGEGFLGSVTGVAIGIIVGAVLAILSYVFWYVGALLSAGATGALLGSGLMNALRIDTGWLVFIGAAAGAILVFILALRLALPVYVVIVNTAFLGAAAVITAVLLIFNQVDRADLGYGVAWAAIDESWFWLVAWAVLAVTGMLAQLQTMAAIRLPENRWAPANAA